MNGRPGLFALAITAVVFAALIGCSQDGGPVANPAATLEAQSAVSDDDIRHFLTRTHFGVRPADFAAVKAVGLPAYIDEMVDFAPTPALEAAALGHVNDPDFPYPNELAQYWLHILCHTEQPFQEVMALFWHDHFATSQTVLISLAKHWYFDHIRLLRTHGAGNLRQFLFEIATDWSMLRWLDGTANMKGDPNENFAREFFELFALGADNGYTQKDIVEAARCFTGFRIFTNPQTNKQFLQFEESRHDAGYKTIFGQTIAGRAGADAVLEYMDVIDATLNHRAAAEYFCKRLFEYFCYPDAEPEIVAELANLLRASNWELKPVLRKILLSQAFFGQRSRLGQVKSPVEFALGFIRATGLAVPMPVLDLALEAAGQRITLPPNVNGWPNGRQWLASQWMLERTNLLRHCVAQDAFQANLGFDIQTLLPAEKTPEAIVDHLAQWLCVDLTLPERAIAIEYMNTDRNPQTNAHIPSPFDPALHTESRVRGLLYLLGQHPSYHVR